MTEVELVLGGVHHWQHLEEDHLCLHAMLQNLLHQCSHYHWTQSHFRFQSQWRIWPLSENNKINEHTVTYCYIMHSRTIILWVQHSSKTLLTGLQIIFFSLERTYCDWISPKKVENFIFLKLHYTYFLASVCISMTYNYYFNSKKKHFDSYKGLLSLLGHSINWVEAKFKHCTIKILNK